jgi:DNA-directed RNA polymerase subunit K/omega
MKGFHDIEHKAAMSGNQYLLALAASKRVKHLRNGAPALVQGTPTERPIETALEELARGAIEYRVPEKQESDQ